MMNLDLNEDQIKATLPLFPAIAALVVSIISCISCRFVSFPPIYDTLETIPVSLHFGIWSYQEWTSYYREYNLDADPSDFKSDKWPPYLVNGITLEDTCTSYPSDFYLDGRWKGAMAGSILSPALGAPLLLWARVSSSLCPRRHTFMAGGVLFLLCSLFQGLTLLMLQADLPAFIAVHGPDATADQKIGHSSYWTKRARVDTGALLSIIALLLWTMSAYLYVTSTQSRQNEGVNQARTSTGEEVEDTTCESVVVEKQEQAV